MIDVSIIMVNYNTKELTINAIESIKEHTKEIEYEIIVVDNNSSDNSSEEIKKRFPDVLLIDMPYNVGFGQGNNQALKIAKGKYFFLLNTDTLILNNVVKIFFDWFEKNKNRDKIGAIGTYLIDENKRETHSYGNFLTLNSALKREMFFIFKKSFENLEVRDIEKKVDYVIGADLFISRSVIRNIGDFDQQFFMYFEETDLQMRMELSGYKRFIILGPEIVHLENRSIKTANLKRIFYDKSKLLYLKKYNMNCRYKVFYISYFAIKSFKNLFLNYTLKEKINYLKEVFFNND